MLDHLPPAFQDIDSQPRFEKWQRILLDPETLNFAIEFDSCDAYAADSLDANTLDQYLNSSQKAGKSVRWVHIFGPERQVEAIQIIAKKYGLSPRLTRLLCSPNPLTRDTDRPNVERLRQTHARLVEGLGPSSPNTPKRESLEDSDLERAATTALEKRASSHHQNVQVKQEKLNHYNIANNVWHYWSFDLGGEYMCVGFNSLSNLGEHDSGGDDDHQGPRAGQGVAPEQRHGRDTSYTESLPSKPDAFRLWNWLLFCNDGTIVSIQENPFPSVEQAGAALTDTQCKYLSNSRQNLSNVFRHLSKGNAGEELAIDTLEIRPNMGSHNISTVHLADSPGLLFYYLFDDWYTAFTLVADDEYRYSIMLERLRRSMFQRAKLEKIERLHEVGRQVAVLKRVYESYILLIDRVLRRQHSPGSSSLRPGSTTEASPANDYDVTQYSEEGSQVLQMRLTPKAQVKFERLGDRIKMYAISELDECLEEKESLVFMNFNLMTMRQSQAVEKLTRITILLAKVTIMFMPVSVMTAYFSTQIEDLQNVYTAKTYWVCFVITIFLSFLLLLGFGLISHTLEGWLVYQSITQASLKLPREFMAWLGVKRRRR